MKKYLVAGLALLALGLSYDAAAIGEREKGVLIGIAGTLLGQELIQNHRNHGAHGSYGSPAPVYIPRGYGTRYLEGVRDGYSTRIQAEIEQIRACERRQDSLIYQCGSGNSVACRMIADCSF